MSWLVEAYLEEAFKYSRKIEKRYSMTDEKQNNEYVIVQGYKDPMRARSCMLVLKGDEVFMAINDPNSVRPCKIPGGSWDHNEDPKDCAIRETQEEVRMNVRNVKHCGYIIEYWKEVPDWVKRSLPEDQWFTGCYSEIFVGEYDSEYTGYIKKADRDSLINNGKFYKIDKVKNKMPKEFYQAIQKYLKEER